MNNFKDYLEKTGEVGYVKKVFRSICFVEGLPGLHLRETVAFENGALGLAFSLNENYAEIILLSNSSPIVGESVARTAHYASIGLGDYLLGSVIDPLGYIFSSKQELKIEKSERIDREPISILGRREITQPFYTGVKLIDIAVPLGKGQRELVIGERKTGKSFFLNHIITNQVKNGVICIYAAIGKRQQDLDIFLNNMLELGISSSIVSVISGAADTPGKIYLTPYTAMTIAEYFRDKGKDVLVILDDMTSHASYYRELSLEAKRFPGRSSYPGDIFYAHARIMERAGNFEKGSITCIPVADTVMGDLSGYIQTNLMSMTDGHIYFDIDRYNQGLRPAVNPFLSVTRVGLQAQSPIVKDVSRQVGSFLVKLESMKDLMHFGAEAGDQVKQTISLGDKLMAIFHQDTRETFPINLTLYLIALIWGGYGKESQLHQVEEEYAQIYKKYLSDQNFSGEIDKMIMATPSFADLVSKIKATHYEG